jgi:hypothetical protein
MAQVEAIRQLEDENRALHSQVRELELANEIKLGQLCTANARITALEAELMNCQQTHMHASTGKEQQQRITQLEGALKGLVEAITLPNNAMRVFATWVDEYAYRETELKMVREAILQAQHALTPEKDV